MSASRQTLLDGRNSARPTQSKLRQQQAGSLPEQPPNRKAKPIPYLSELPTAPLSPELPKSNLASQCLESEKFSEFLKFESRRQIWPIERDLGFRKSLPGAPTTRESGREPCRLSLDCLPTECPAKSPAEYSWSVHLRESRSRSRHILGEPTPRESMSPADYPWSAHGLCLIFEVILVRKDQKRQTFGKQETIQSKEHSNVEKKERTK